VDVRTKLVINYHIIEQVNICNYLGYTITLTNNRDLEIKMNRLNQMCSTRRITPKNKTRKNNYAHFYKDMVVPALTYKSEIQTITPNKKRKQKFKLQT
jgi:hypothetical protein